MSDKQKFLAVLILLPTLLLTLLAIVIIGTTKSTLTIPAEPPAETQPATTASPEPVPVRLPLACDGTALGSPPEGFASALQDMAASGVEVQAAWLNTEGTVERGGTQETMPAWSTAKVPVALAAAQAGMDDQLSWQISASLRSSDNAAAAAVWNSLGQNDSQRAAATTRVFREAGDDNTTVPETALRPGFSVFGQTRWDVQDQFAFLLQLPCMAGSDAVIENMANIDQGQRWGLGTLPGAVFKGGWGPDQDGYVVRQFGWFENNGRVPVAISVRASSFEQGTSALSQIAASLQ